MLPLLRWFILIFRSNDERLALQRSQPFLNLMFQVLRIHGESMSPEYEEGDFVLIMKIFRGKIKMDDVIVFQHQMHGTLIKAVEKITDEGIYVLGRGENSLDSRRLGPVNPLSVQGRVIWHIRRA